MSEIAGRRECHDFEKHWGLRRRDTGRRKTDRLCSYARPPVRRPPGRNPRRIRGSPGVSIRLLCDWRESHPSLARRTESGRRGRDLQRSPAQAISAKRDLSAEFRVIRRGGPDEDLTLSSLHSDLVVIGQRELQELKGYASPEKLLLSSGAPILVIPSGWKSESIGNKILVGWNASREARRAVADALPFLVAASSVTLLVVDSEQRAGRHGEDPGADIALYLARHGARVEVEQVLSQGAPVADIILSYAAEHGVDLIVIGAYSHARTVEMMLGGVTRTLLKEAPVPVLMSR